MMNKLIKRSILCAMGAAIALSCMVLPAEVWAGDLFQLMMRYEAPEPSGYPVHIVVNVYDNDNFDANDLVATSAVDFDGASMSNLVCDAYVCITDVAVEGGKLVVNYTADGYKGGGDFESNSAFEVVVDGMAAALPLHTSCSRPIYVERPYPGDPVGTFYVEGGEGDCFIGPDDCPDGNDLYWLTGEFRVPCPYPGQITFNAYKDDNDLRGTATAYFNGAGLVDIQNSLFTVLNGATTDAGELVINFTVYGWKDGGDFDSNARWEVVTSCGGYYLDQHTSCSQEIYLNIPQDAAPAGSVTYTDGCGGCIETGVPPVECPYDDKLYWLAGEFYLDCAAPADLTFTVYEKDQWDQPRGTATATFDGSSLTNVVNDLVALLAYARMDGDQMVIGFEAFGFDNDKFKTETSLEIMVSGCGMFRLVKYHTSCSRPIELDTPLAMEPLGTTILLDYCGCEDSTIPTEEASWSGVKALYR
jgi:hypothetical protein